MRFCLIVEAKYREARMPLAVGRHLAAIGHEVDLLEPQATVSCLTDLQGGEPAYDAYILKTVSDGPGRSLIEAAAATGITTINDARAIHLVRDKAVAAAAARQHGIPFPPTYFLSNVNLIDQVPPALFPVVVKPALGSEGRDVRLVRNPREASSAQPHGFVLVQPYLRNPGYDLKLYRAGGLMFAVRRPSPLSGETSQPDQLVPLTVDLRRLLERVGRAFGLDIFGVDVLETAGGPVVVDVNDFPSFSMIPDAVESVAATIVRIADERRRGDVGTRRRDGGRPMVAGGRVA